jgi:hypothetical protein
MNGSRTRSTWTTLLDGTDGCLAIMYLYFLSVAGGDGSCVDVAGGAEGGRVSAPDRFALVSDFSRVTVAPPALCGRWADSFADIAFFSIL